MDVVGWRGEGMRLMCYGLDESAVVRVSVYMLGESLQNVWVGGRGEGWEMIEMEGFVGEVEAEESKVWLWVGDRLVMHLP